MKYKLHFLLCLLLAQILGITAAVAQSSEAYGVISSGDNAGIYKYAISPQGITNVEKVNAFTLSTEVNNSDKISGGFLVGEKYYYSMAHLNARGYQSDGIYCYDMEENATRQIVSWDYEQQGPSCASWFYDFQNETMYALNGFQGGGNRVMQVDLETGELSPVCTFNITEQPSWASNPENYTSSVCAIAMTYDGDVYAVGYWGGLYKVDLTTGACQYIGGMKDACPNPANGQVAFQYQGACDLVYDNDNDRLYLFMYQYPPTQYVPLGYGGIGSGYALFEVNRETAEVTYMMDTGEGMNFIGNCIPFSVAEASAPQAPQNLTATRGERGALEVTLEWDNPSRTYGRGGTLEELDSVVVYRNDERVYKVEQPVIGGHVSWTDRGLTERGNYSYRVSGWNGMGQGDRASVKLFVGPGDPLAPSDATLTAQGADARVTWVAPTEGRYGSWIDTEDLTYDVVRQPDGVAVATGTKQTELTDNTVPAIGFYSYEIVAHAGGYDSEKAATEALMVGPAIEVPARIGFGSLDEFRLWRSYDLNGNGYGFNYSESWPLYRPCAYVTYQYDNVPASDLLVSPYLRLEAGKHYKLVFDATFNTKKVPEELAITFGKSNALEAQDSVTTFFVTPDADKQTFRLRANLPVVEKDSTYHVGFYYRSWQMPAYGVYLENVDVLEDHDGYVAGRVTNAGGEAVGGALLLINGGEYHTTTDGDGRYVLNYLPAGEYGIDVQALGYESQRVSARVEELATTELDVVLTALPEYCVKGTVKDVAGDAIAGAEVAISGYNGYVATTDAEGVFEVPRVFANGYYSLRVSKNKYVPMERSFSVSEDVDFGVIVLEDDVRAPRGVRAAVSEDGASAVVEWESPANDPRWVRYDDGSASTHVGVAVDSERGIGGSNAVFGIIDRTPSTVHGLTFHLGSTAQVQTHYSVGLRIFDLDEDGNPTRNLLYENSYVPALDDEWTTYELPAPVDAPRGYFVALSHYTWMGLSIDGGADGDAEQWPFRERVNCFSGNWQGEPFLYLDDQNAGLRHNFMLRAWSSPWVTDDDVDVEQARAWGFANGQSNGEEGHNNIVEGHSNIDNNNNGTVELEAAQCKVSSVDGPSSMDDCFSRGPAKSVQSRVRYDVYRFRTADVADESKWEKLASETPALSYEDAAWGGLEQGVYCYGVKAVYTGGKESAAVVSDSIGKGMEARVVFRLRTNTPENEAYGAKVLMVNGGGRHVYEGVAGEDGLVTFGNVWKADYDVTVSLDGFLTENSHYVFTSEDEFAFDVTLEENRVKPFNLLVEEVEGEVSSRRLIWNYPDYFFEGFEEHEDFAVNSPGVLGWQYLDGDGGETAGVYGFGWPNQFAPMAFQVFNPYSDLARNEDGTSILSYLPGLTPRTGQRMLTDWAAYDVANDDWIITPRLHFQEDFVFRFYAKCIDYQYLETFRVLYSTTGTEKEDFMVLKDNVTAYSYYQGYSVEVPKEARYVAIQCTSEGKRVFCVDDIEFGIPSAMPAGGYFSMPGQGGRKVRRMPSLDGAYEVYLDGRKIADTDETEFVLEGLAEGSHTAGVVASYTSGKTEMSTISFSVDATDGIEVIDHSPLTIGHSQNGVFDLEGRKVGASAPLRRGVYIVKGRKYRVTE